MIQILTKGISMNNKQSMTVAHYPCRDQYAIYQTREKALNDAILQANIIENFEQYLEIFDAFYADDLEVTSETHERPIQGKARVIKPDVQGLLKKVSVRPNHEYTDEYPAKMPAKITVRLQDGKVIEHEVQDYPGLASHPFSWEDSVEKFDRLVAGRADKGLSGEIKDAVRSLESIQVRDLMQLLGRVRAAASAASSNTI